MKERPIICSGHSVRAILAGTKTQTRRICSRAIDHGGEMAKSIHPDGAGSGWIAWFGPFEVSAEETAKIYPSACGFLPPHGAKGYWLWVREAWGITKGNGIRTIYRADGEQPFGLDGTQVIGPMKWGSPMFMPRRASRIDLEITGVRVERLQDITEADAVAEGMQFHDGNGVGHSGWRHDVNHGFVYPSAREAFAQAWDSINQKRAKWYSNPWVWVYEFRRVKP